MAVSPKVVLKQMSVADLEILSFIGDSSGFQRRPKAAFNSLSVPFLDSIKYAKAATKSSRTVFELGKRPQVVAGTSYKAAILRSISSEFFN